MTIDSESVPRLLARARGLGKLYSEDIRTTRNTSVYEDLGRRVLRLRQHQERLIALLNSPRKLRGSDILYIQDRLFRAGVDEDMLLQQRLDFERASRTSSMRIELFEPTPHRAMDIGNWYAGAMLRARTSGYAWAAKATTALAFVITFAPLWIPGLIALLLVQRWLKKNVKSLVVRIAEASRSALDRWRAQHPQPPPPADAP